MSSLRQLSWLLLGLVATAIPADACTTGVFSGRATPDGRPLLWKNRDISTIHNEVVRIEGGRYSVLAVVNAGSRSSIWMGVNEAGLCIENSVTKDLAAKGASGPGNGGFMLLVLQKCATVGEVKELLAQTDRTGRSTTANFGVIDAHGGAALFESAPRSHVMFDANDPQVAPNGYIVRSNFSVTGQKLDVCLPQAEQLGEIYSAQRYLRADAIARAAVPSGLDARYLAIHCARDLSAEDGLPFAGTVNGEPGELPPFIPTRNTISRTTTVSFAVFQGVKPGEDPLLTTMWVGLGDPKFTVAVPCWLAAGPVPSELQGGKACPLCDSAIKLRGCFFDKAQDGIHTAGVADVWTSLRREEASTFDRVQGLLEKWRTQGIDRRSMQAVQTSAAEQALAAIKTQLQSNPSPAPATAPAGQQ